MTDKKAVSYPKKRKLGSPIEREDIYATFVESYVPSHMVNLKTAIRSLVLDKKSSLKVCSLNNANCSEAASFKEAYVSVEEHIDKLFPIAGIFTKGLGILTSFLKTKSVPTESIERSLLEVLLTYLLDNDVHEALTCMDKYCKTETDITVMIVNHLLLRITPNARCLLDKGGSYNLFPICPDHCEIQLKNTKIDDTTIGNPKVWHGHVDALIGSVALTKISDSGDDDYDDHTDDDDSFVPHSKSRFVEVDIPSPQVISKAIVFSFLQNQRDSQHRISLIPTIGISGTQLVIYFYDSENDVLLQSAGFFFNRSPEDKIRTILVAWLVVNYKHLCDGLTDQLTTVPKANFVNLCDETALNIYKSCLMHRGVGKGDRQSLSVFKYEHSVLEIPPAAQKIYDDLACL